MLRRRPPKPASVNSAPPLKALGVLLLCALGQALAVSSPALADHSQSGAPVSEAKSVRRLVPLPGSGTPYQLKRTTRPTARGAACPPQFLPMLLATLMPPPPPPSPPSPPLQPGSQYASSSDELITAVRDSSINRIVLLAGIYEFTSDMYMCYGSAICIDRALTIEAEVPGAVVLNAMGEGRIFIIQSGGTAELIGLHITGGRSIGSVLGGASNPNPNPNPNPNLNPNPSSNPNPSLSTHPNPTHSAADGLRRR